MPTKTAYSVRHLIWNLGCFCLSFESFRFRACIHPSFASTACIWSNATLLSSEFLRYGTFLSLSSPCSFLRFYCAQQPQIFKVQGSTGLCRGILTNSCSIWTAAPKSLCFACWCQVWWPVVRCEWLAGGYFSLKWLCLSIRCAASAAWSLKSGLCFSAFVLFPSFHFSHLGLFRAAPRRRFGISSC